MNLKSKQIQLENKLNSKKTRKNNHDEDYLKLLKRTRLNEYGVKIK